MAKKPTAPKSTTPKAAAPPVPPESAPAITPADMPPDPPTGPITSAAAPPAHAGPPPTKKGALLGKAKLHAPPTLLFQSGFHQVVRGDLHPNTARHPTTDVLTIYYSTGRLPRDIDTSPGWRAYAHLRYGNGGEPLTLPLWSPTGQVVTSSSGLGEAPKLTAQTPAPVPADAREVEVWFSFELGDGRVLWDSDNGRNYHFRFTHDIVVTYADVVVPNPPAPNDNLEVTIETDDDVASVAIDYQVTNTLPDPPHLVAVALQRQDALTAEGCRQWTVKGVCVPHRAVLYFTVRYSADGYEVVDDNNGRGYLVS